MLASVQESPSFRVLYLFAGNPRKADVRFWLTQFCTARGFTLEMLEIDVCRDASMDLLDEDQARRFLQEIQAGRWDFVIVTPPCNTFSRARCSTRTPGPKPVRSRLYPFGFPWLSSKLLNLVQNGNQFVKFSIECCNVALQRGCHFVLEHPEDLGKLANGCDLGSIWQWEDVHHLMTRAGVTTFAVHQCHYGATSPKPTRFLTSAASAQRMKHTGPPTLDRDGFYIGPLPRYCGHRSHEELIGLDEQGNWKSSAAAAYPEGLCSMIADLVGSVYEGGSTQSSPSPSEDLDCDQLSQPSGEQLPEDLTYDQLFSGCQGPPLTGEFAGQKDEFVDGFGRCSPGRWAPKNRGKKLSDEARSFAMELKDTVRDFVIQEIPDMARATFRLATGRWEGPLFRADAMDALREKWFSMLPDPERARVLVPHQPYFLRAMAQTLELLEDPDFRILEEGKFCFCNGVSVGHVEPLGPNPQVYRLRRKDQKYDESEWEPEMTNYRDGEETSRILEEVFAKEEAEGRMFPLSLAEARRRYPGSSLRIAAQGALPKPGGDFRVIHDGTHGVQVNNEIVIRDRLESPSAREISTVHRVCKAADQSVVFGLVGDIQKAHRRYLHHPEHWGVLACKTSSRSEVIWLNRTGTFGIASAAFWFSRLAGLTGRLTLRVLLDTFLFMMIFADDLHLCSGGRERWLNLWMALALMEMQGTPFAGKKWRGGLQLDWVGYWMDYSRFLLGISERRCQWILDTITGLEQSLWLVDVRRFHELHGRLGFMSQVLPWIRPLLAPGYAWLAAVQKGAVLTLPSIIRCVLRFIQDKLERGRRTYDTGSGETELGELFRTDAACNESSVVLGGWFFWKGHSCWVAPWFQLTLTPSEVPWLFKEELGSSWASTTAELLASLVAIYILGRDFKDLIRSSGCFRATFQGGTDNKAAESLSLKQLTTKVQRKW